MNQETKAVMDYHNNDLVAEVRHFIDNGELLGAMTDLEWLDHIAAIVSQRKFRWGVTDCTTGLTYSQDK